MDNYSLLLTKCESLEKEKAVSFAKEVANLAANYAARAQTSETERLAKRAIYAASVAEVQLSEPYAGDTAVNGNAFHAAEAAVKTIYSALVQQTGRANAKDHDLAYKTVTDLLGKYQ